jgi:hypothetical protein
MCSSSPCNPVYVTRFSFLVFHHTDTHIYVLSSALVFLIHNQHKITHSTGGLFHFHHTVVFSQVKSRVDNILTKVAVVRVNLNLDGEPITSRTHTHPSHSETSRLLTLYLVFIFRCSSSPNNPVYTRRVDSSSLVLVFHHTYTHILDGKTDLLHTLSIHNKERIKQHLFIEPTIIHWSSL